MNECDNRPFYTIYKRQIKTLPFLIVAMGLLLFGGFLVYDHILLTHVLEFPSENSITEYETKNITGYYDEDFSILKIEFRKNPDEILDFIKKYPQSEYLHRTSLVLNKVWIDYQTSFNQLIHIDTLVSEPMHRTIIKLLTDYSNGVYEPVINTEQHNQHEEGILTALVNHTEFAANLYVPSSEILEQYANLIDAVYSDQNVVKISNLIVDPSGNIFEKTIAYYKALLSNDIKQVRSYIRRSKSRSESKDLFILSLQNVYDRLWKLELEAFDKRTSKLVGEKRQIAQKLKGILIFLKDSFSSDVFLEVSGTQNVKDFLQYDDQIIERLNDNYLKEYGRSLSENMLSISDHFSEGNVDEYGRIIEKAIQSGFEDFISQDYLTVLHSNQGLNSQPTIKITYRIENQEDEYDRIKFPLIWQYTVNGAFESYLIGVSIHYRLELLLPGNTPYTLSYSSLATDDIQGIRDIEDGYAQMTKQNFTRFASDLRTSFGFNIIESN